MKKSLCLLAALLPLSLTCPAFAAEYTDTVPVELAARFMGGTAGDSVRYFDGVPDRFPELEFPAELELLGSVIQNSRVRVLLQAKLDQNAVYSLLSESFIAAGWQPIPMMSSAQIDAMRRVGGPASDFMTRTNNYCHDELGTVRVGSLNSMNGATFMELNYDISPRRFSPSCAAQLQEAETAPVGTNLAFEMPSIELPQNLASRGGSMPAPNLTMFAGGAQLIGSLQIESDIAQLLSAFAPQLEAQGWLLDVDSAGTSFGSSYWSRNAGNGDGLIGIFSVMSMEPGRYKVMFQIQSPAVEAVSPSGGMSFVR